MIQEFIAAVLAKVLINLVNKYVIDPAFREKLDAAVKLVKEAKTEKERLDASTALQSAIVGK